jgi:hypothetical protein
MKRGTVIALAVVAVALLWGYRWATSAASVDLDQSRHLVALLREEGHLVKSSCNPNTATIKGASWAYLNETRQRNTMLALARICIELGSGPTMEVHEAGSQRLLATFDGRNLHGGL